MHDALRVDIQKHLDFCRNTLGASDKLTFKNVEDVKAVIDGMCAGDGWKMDDMAKGRFAYAKSLPLVFLDPLGTISEQYLDLCNQHTNGLGTMYPEATVSYDADMNRVYGHPMSGTWANVMQSLIRQVRCMNAMSAYSPVVIEW